MAEAGTSQRTTSPNRGRTRPAPRRMGLGITPNTYQMIEVCRGAIEYAGAHGPWLLHTKPRSGFAPLSDMVRFEGDGLITHVPTAEMEDQLLALPIPVVNTSSLLLSPRLPSVFMDNLAVGKSAAEHLLACGLRHLAFSGYVGHGYSQVRERAFKETTLAAGAVFHEQPALNLPLQHDVGAIRYFDVEVEALADWLTALPRPLGVMGCNDMRARMLLATCDHAQLRVPEDVAIVGVDDDPLLCQTSHPPLSSVAIRFRQVGYEAAALLDRLMQGEAPPTRPVRIPPIGVVARQSSDSLAIEDPHVAQAVYFIRQNAVSGITVEDVIETLPLSRRSLERRFEQALGRSPYAEILRIRIDIAKHLLATTDLPMPQVARKAGFPNAERLSVIFRRLTGTPPTGYRQQYRQL